MKMFDQAIMKLTAIYSAIIMIICIGFSVTIFSSASNELDRIPTMRTSLSEMMNNSENIQEMVRGRDNEFRQQFFIFLIITDIIIISGGVVVSYFLARMTLKPISQNMESQKQFVANASHELKTPMTVIAMENEVILRAKSPTKSELTDQIRSNVEEIKKLQKLTSNLLELSQDEKVDLQKVNVKEVTKGVIERMKKVADSKKITLENKVSVLKVDANHDMLSETLTILVDNAIKYSPENSRVTIKSAHGKILVSDEGCGIDKDDLPYIFERFYRAEKSHTTDGYGLGLSLAKHLAEQMNMNISAQNNPKKGTTFIIG